MKGQYMAVESVLTFGLGIIVATGIIGLFSNFSTNVFDAAEEAEAEATKNQLKEAFNSLEPVSGTAEKDIDLPDTVSNSDYTVVFSGDEMVLETRSSEYSSTLPVSEPLRGSGSGDVRLVKSDEGYELAER